MVPFQRGDYSDVGRRYGGSYASGAQQSEQPKTGARATAMMEGMPQVGPMLEGFRSTTSAQTSLGQGPAKTAAAVSEFQQNMLRQTGAYQEQLLGMSQQTFDDQAEWASSTIERNKQIAASRRKGAGGVIGSIGKLAGGIIGGPAGALVSGAAGLFG